MLPLFFLNDSYSLFGRFVQLGEVVCDVWTPKEEALVPSTLFFDIPQQKLVLKNMLRDVVAKEHLLLMGNQGVGKNKMADRLLMLLHREREYIQLHRDTTVGSLTLAPTMRKGVVVFDDSPLVKALMHGRVLVVDEFDKAPTEVVVVLKALLEDGEILLADGRRFVRANSPMVGIDDNIKPIHPTFLVIALANRPGFPFLGNDFFREVNFCM
jgi:MoxR-like ATPase